MVAFIRGSLTSFILVCSGHSAGLCISKASSLVFKTLYTTLGGVTIKSKENSLLSLS